MRQGSNGTGFGDPVWTYDGSLYLKYTDISVGAHFPIQLTRRYDSKSEYDSAVGYGCEASSFLRVMQK